MAHLLLFLLQIFDYILKLILAYALAAAQNLFVLGVLAQNFCHVFSLAASG
jgi:hypothetical protein